MIALVDGGMRIKVRGDVEMRSRKRGSRCDGWPSSSSFSSTFRSLANSFLTSKL